MWKNLILAMALAGAGMAIALSIRSTARQPIPPPYKQPAVNPYRKGIAGAGIVESASENVVLGVNDAGRVAKVFVREGQRVKAGDPILKTDTTDLEAQRFATEAAVNTAQAALDRVEAYQRPENGAILSAQLAQTNAQKGEAEQAVAEARLAVSQQEWQIKDQEDQVARLEVTVKSHASPEQDLVHAKFVLEEFRVSLDLLKQKVLTAQSHVETAMATSLVAQANLQMFQAGAWKQDVDNAQSAVAQAKAQLKQLDLQIERRTVRSPIDAVVLRREIREGEYAVAQNPLADAGAVGIVLGNIDDIHVRIDIDEFDAQRYRAGMDATAFFKTGDGSPMPLEFVRVEPFVIPKRSLTNSQTELVDTRVLQVIYKIKNSGSGLYIGQQLDVYFDEESAPTSLAPNPSHP